MRKREIWFVEQTLAGDCDAFADLVAKYRDAACAMAYTYFGGFDDVQDAVQESFIQAYTRLDQLREPEKFGPWLRQITINVCKGILRRPKKPEISIEDIGEQKSPDAAGDPQRSTARMVVNEALGRLSEKARLTVTLSYINGYSHAEIAEFLDVPLNTVRSRLRIAKKQLREEMIEMVTDVLHEDKPNDEFVRRIVDIMRSRHMASTPADSIRYDNEMISALAEGEAKLPPGQVKASLLHAVDRWELPSEEYEEIRKGLSELPPDEAPKAVRAMFLLEKSRSSRFVSDEQSDADMSEAAAIIEQLADSRYKARLFCLIGMSRNGTGRNASEYYEKALKLAQKFEYPEVEAECLQMLAGKALSEDDIATAKHQYTQALRIFEKTGDSTWGAVCRAMLDMLAEVGEKRFLQLLYRTGAGNALERKDSAVALVGSAAWGGGRAPDDVPPMEIYGVFWQLAQLDKFLDESMAVGESLSGDAWSYSNQPLKATLTMLSRNETATVPAGEFSNCLLTELVLTESGSEDDAPDELKQRNREHRCGRKLAWYAPGVGLVKLHVALEGGNEARIELREFSVRGATTEYLPLSVGNSWSYEWANIPEDYVSREVHRVLASKGERWYLEQYHYAYKK